MTMREESRTQLKANGDSSIINSTTFIGTSNTREVQLCPLIKNPSTIIPISDNSISPTSEWFTDL